MGSNTTSGKLFPTTQHLNVESSSGLLLHSKSMSYNIEGLTTRGIPSFDSPSPSLPGKFPIRPTVANV